VEGITDTPDNIGLEYENVLLKTADGLSINGWYVPADDERAVVLFCHGNGGNMSNRLETLRILNRLGLSTFIFDYRGYGDSEGKPSEKGTYRDTEAAWRWIKERRSVAAGDIIVMGRSLGGPVAAWIARKYPPKALILESTFTNIHDMGKKLFPWLPIRLMSRFRYAAEKYVHDIHCPVLVIHSPVDDLVPYELGRKLYDAVNDPKEFLEIDGAHNDGFLMTGEPYIVGLDRFITKCLRDRQ